MDGEKRGSVSFHFLLFKGSMFTYPLTTQSGLLFLSQVLALRRQRLNMFCVLTDSPEVHNFTCMTRNLNLLECSWKQGNDRNLKGDRKTNYSLNGRYYCFAYLLFIIN